MLRTTRTLRASAGDRKLRALWRSRSGTSAIEFALVLPFMLALMVGAAEMAHAVDNWRKVTLLARTVADLTSQGDKQNPISSATMSDILASSAAVLRPFNAADARIVVSALSVDAAALAVNHPRVCSSTATGNASPRSTGIATALTIPAGLGQLGSRYVLAEVRMSYAPVMGGSLVALVGGSNGAISLDVSLPWPTRGGQAYGSKATEVILPGGAQCP